MIGTGAMTTSDDLLDIGGLYDKKRDFGELNPIAMWVRLFRQKSCHMYLDPYPSLLKIESMPPIDNEGNFEIQKIKEKSKEIEKIYDYYFSK